MCFRHVNGIRSGTKTGSRKEPNWSFTSCCNCSRVNICVRSSTWGEEKLSTLPGASTSLESVRQPYCYMHTTTATTRTVMNCAGKQCCVSFSQIRPLCLKTPASSTQLKTKSSLSDKVSQQQNQLSGTNYPVLTPTSLRSLVFTALVWSQLLLLQQNSCKKLRWTWVNFWCNKTTFWQKTAWFMQTHIPVDDFITGRL